MAFLPHHCAAAAAAAAICPPTTAARVAGAVSGISLYAPAQRANGKLSDETPTFIAVQLDIHCYSWCTEGQRRYCCASVQVTLVGLIAFTRSVRRALVN